MRVRMRVNIKRWGRSEKGRKFYHAYRALNGGRSQPAAEMRFPCAKRGWGNEFHRRKAFFTSLRFGEYERGRAPLFSTRGQTRGRGVKRGRAWARVESDNIAATAVMQPACAQLLTLQVALILPWRWRQKPAGSDSDSVRRPCSALRNARAAR